MSYDSLKIAVIEHDISWSDRDDNLQSVAQLLSRVDRNTDLVILPELFSTGLVTNIMRANDLAEPVNGHTIDAVHRWAKFFNFAIIGTAMVLENNKIYNRAFMIEPSGDMTFYDKYHLFGQEKDIFTQGDRRQPIVRFRGWDIALATCYDLRFPTWLRNHNCRYDLLVIPANWPDSRIYAFQQLLIARAIENQAYVAGCNRRGSDDFGSYDGKSLIVDFKGYPIQGIGSVDKILYASLDRQALKRFRDSFPVWKDFD